MKQLAGIRGAHCTGGTLRVCLVNRLGTRITQVQQDPCRPIRPVRKKMSDCLAQGLDTEIIFLAVPLHPIEERGDIDQLGP